MAVETKIARVAFMDKGVYSAEIEYSKWDFVTTADSTYLYIGESPAIGKPVTDTAYWKCIADGKQATEAAGQADAARVNLTNAVNTKLGEADDKIEEMDTTLSTYEGRMSQAESDITQLAGDVALTASYDMDIYDNDIVVPISIITDKYIHPNGSLVSLSVYSVNVYQLDPGTPFRVRGENIGVNATYAYYADEALTQLVKVGDVNSTGLYYNIDKIDIVPPDALYVGLTKNDSYNISLYIANKEAPETKILSDKLARLNLNKTNYFRNNRFPNDTVLNINGLSPNKVREEFYYFSAAGAEYVDSVMFNYWGRALKLTIGATPTNFWFNIPSTQIVNDEYFLAYKNININYEIWAADAKKATFRIYKEVGGVLTQIGIKGNFVLIPGVNTISFADIELSDANFGLTIGDHIQIRIFPETNGAITWANDSVYFGRINVFSGDYSESLDYVNNYNPVSIPAVQSLITTNKVLSYWYEKKMVTIGDSITAQNTWQPEISRRIGVIYNPTEVSSGIEGHAKMGVGGSTITPYITGLSGQTEGLSIYSRADDVHYYNPEIIILFGGQNDKLESMGGSIPLGTINDTPYAGAEVTISPPSFYASYMGTVEKLCAQNPTALIVLVTPLLSTDQSYAIKKSKCDAIEEIGYRYGLPVVNLLKDVGINSINLSSFISDGVHPNANGGILIGQLISVRLT